MLVLTGCRRDEVRDARWGEFDLAAKTWTIPGRRTKNGRDHIVPLSPQAMTVLESITRVRSKVGFLLTKNGQNIIGGLGRAKELLDLAMADKLGKAPEPWVLHDIRRTFVTGLQKLGVRLEVTEAAVNHRSGAVSGVTAVYAKHDYAEEKRAALDAWAPACRSNRNREAGKHPSVWGAAMTTDAAEQWRFRAAVYAFEQGKKEPLLELLRDGLPLTLSADDKQTLADYFNGKLIPKRKKGDGRPPEQLYSHTWQLQQAVAMVRDYQKRYGLKRSAAVEMVIIGAQLQGKDLDKRRGEIVQALSRGKNKSDKKSRTK